MDHLAQVVCFVQQVTGKEKIGFFNELRIYAYFSHK